MDVSSASEINLLKASYSFVVMHKSLVDILKKAKVTHKLKVA